MSKTLKTVLIVIALAIVIYLGLDHWQENVTIYANSCETGAGQPLPMRVCKAIVNYRYQKSD